MIIEIRGTGTHNKGAELMAHAILQHFQKYTQNHDISFVVQPNFGTYKARAKLNLYLKTVPSSTWGRTRLMQGILSSSATYRDIYGIVKEKDIDIILDASGFAYSDQWGPEPAEQLVRQIRNRRDGTKKKIILLPQAFGPFTNRRTIKAFKEIQANVDLIFARETESFNHIKSIDCPMERVKIAPDFTNLVSAVIPPYWNSSSQHALLIPNLRMLDKSTSFEKSHYISFLCTCIHEATNRGLAPALLLHSPEDRKILQKLQTNGTDLDVIIEEDPLYIKGIIGTASCVIASRFHALVSALSQGIPAIGTGWSHKYKCLFVDYQCPELLLSTQSPLTDIKKAFDSFTEPHLRQNLINRISSNSEKVKTSAIEMWEDIDAILNL